MKPVYYIMNEVVPASNRQEVGIEYIGQYVKTFGPVRDLNPGPLAPKARIIPLDQQAGDHIATSCRSDFPADIFQN